MRRPFFLFTIVLTLAVPTARAQTEYSFGGTADVSFGLLSRSGLEADAFSTGSDLAFSPVMSAAGDTFELELAAEIRYAFESETIEADLIRARLFFPVSDAFTVTLGKLEYRPGFGEFSSPSSFFSSYSPERFLESGLSALGKAQELLQARFFLGSWFFGLTAAPFRMKKPALDPGSPWFPERGVPKVISIPVPTDEERIDILLDGISYEEPDPTHGLSDVSWGAELGGYLFGLDLSLLYYHGWDNSPLYLLRIPFTDFYTDRTFSLVFVPNYSIGHAFGLDLAASAGAFRFWLDSAFTPEKPFNSNRITLRDDGYAPGLSQSGEAGTFFEIATVKLPYLDLVAGGSWNVPLPGTILTAEYRRGFIFAAEAPAPPILSHSLIVHARKCFLEDRLTLDAAALRSFVDESGALLFALSFSPNEHLQLSAYAPVFLGAPFTELGQYRDTATVRTAIALKF